MACSQGGFAPNVCISQAAQNNSPYGAGSGTPTDPYVICTAAQFNNIGLRTQDWGANFVLGASIDLSAYTGTQYNVIGNGLASTYFTGTFNGLGQTISNFTYNGGISYVGLFGAVGQHSVIENLIINTASVTSGNWVGVLVGGDDSGGGGTISNVNILNATISAGANVGGVAGDFSGTISSSSFSGNIYNTGNAGGLIAALTNTTTVNNCYTSGVLSGSGADTGGLVGTGYRATISNSWSSMQMTEANAMGGLLGYFGIGGAISINNSYFTGHISGTGSLGGLVGQVAGANTLSIANSYSTGSLSGSANLIGGLVGSATILTISSSYSTGAIAGNNFVGGLVGRSSNGSAGNGIYNSYSLSSVTGATDVGGLIGEVSAGAPDVQYSFAAGTVTGTTNPGGITGLDNGAGVYVACFFDHTVNGGLQGIASGNAGQLGNTVGDATGQMQTPSTFTNAGWSTSIWNLGSGSYPLLWQ